MNPTNSSSELRATAPPNWTHVHFKVNCARCGQDLHGKSEPKCPACGLEFEWSDAAPVDKLRCGACDYQLYGLNETRCPECGTEFMWEEALDRYRRSRKPLFEYRWRDEPVRSLIRTWWWALWPPKIWSKVEIHDPPKVGPLVAMVVMGLVAFQVLLGLLVTCVWFQSELAYWKTVTTPGRMAAPFGRLFFGSLGFGFLNLELYLPAGVIGIWQLFSLAALTAFPESMARCRVRYVHIIRVWALSTPVQLPLVLLLTIPWLILGVPTLFLSFLAIVHVVWSMRQAYKQYIRMRHCLAVAISSQVMAVLATMTAILLLQDFLP